MRASKRSTWAAASNSATTPTAALFAYIPGGTSRHCAASASATFHRVPLGTADAATGSRTSLVRTHSPSAPRCSVTGLPALSTRNRRYSTDSRSDSDPPGAVFNSTAWRTQSSMTESVTPAGVMTTIRSGRITLQSPNGTPPSRCRSMCAPACAGSSRSAPIVARRSLTGFSEMRSPPGESWSAQSASRPCSAIRSYNSPISKESSTVKDTNSWSRFSTPPSRSCTSPVTIRSSTESSSTSSGFRNRCSGVGSGAPSSSAPIGWRGPRPAAGCPPFSGRRASPPGNTMASTCTRPEKSQSPSRYFLKCLASSIGLPARNSSWSAGASCLI